MPNKKSKSTILAVTILILFMLSSILLTIYNNKNYNKIIINNAHERLETKAQITALGFQKLFLEHIQILKTLSAEPSVIKALVEKNKHSFYTIFCPINNLYKNQAEDIIGAYLFNIKGELFHQHPNFDKELINLSENKDIKYILENKKTHISTEFIDSTNTFGIAIFEPIFNKEEFIGIVKFVLYPKTIGSIFIDSFDNKNSVVAISDSEANIIYSNVNDLCSENMFNLLEKDKEKYPDTDFSGRENFLKNRLSGGSGKHVFDMYNQIAGVNEKVIGVYHSFNVADKLFHVSIVEKYAQIIEPTIAYSKKLYALLALNLLAIIIVLYILLKNAREKAKLKKETAYLKSIEQKNLTINKKIKEYEALNEEYETLNEELAEKNEDLAEQKIKDDELLKSRQKLALHIEQTPLGVIDWNLDFTVNTWNKGAEKIFGYTAEEAIGKHGTELILQDEIKDEITKVWNELAHNTGGNHSINENNTKSGKIIICDWYNTSLIDHSGIVMGVASLVQDITENKHAEQEIKKLNTAIEQSPSTIVITDTAGNIEYVNPAFEKTTGYSSNEAIGLNPRVLKSGKTTKEKYVELWETLTNGKTWQGEFINKKKNGEAYWEYATISPITDDKGEIINYLAVKEDITEKKKIELALKESEEKFKTAFKTSPDAVNINRLEDGLYIETNSGFTRLTGYTEKDLKNKTSKEINIWADWADREKLIKGISKKGYYNNLEAKFKKKDGSVITGLMSARVIMINGEKYILSVTKNIQDIKDVEKELIKAKEKAELSDKLKTAFLANVSHEIRTPMNGILGFAGLLNRSGLSDEKREKYVGIINDNSLQLLSIINDVLDISKIEVGEIDLDESELIVDDLIKGLYETFKPQAITKGVKLIHSIPENQTIIKADITKLRQILTNLLSNALKFTHEGEIEIGYNTDNPSDTSEQINTTINIYVKDTGIGVDKSEWESVFERFRQVELTAARKYGGTGLGLSISRAYAKKMGGSISLESELGKGALFTLILPLKTENIQEKKGALSKNEHINWPNKTILVTEDDNFVFLYLKEILSEKQIKIIHANNGVEAVNICKKNKNIDLVLMDMKMPKMDGYQATKIIKGILPEMPVIAQTAFALIGDTQKAIDAGCDNYLSKPIEEEKLWQVLTKYLQ